MARSAAEDLSEAALLEKKGDWLGAARAYEAVLLHVPDLAEAHYNRANLLRRAGRAEEALVAFDHAVLLRPLWADALLNRGALHMERGCKEAAVKDFQEATRLDPGRAAAWANLGNALSGVGRHAEAIQALRQAVDLNPKGALYHFNLGNAFAAAERTSESAIAFLRALTLDPEFVEAAVNLSSRFRVLGQTEAAHDVACHAVHAAPEMPQAWVAMGNALLDLGNFDVAAGCFRRALALQPSSIAAKVNLALALAGLGAFHEALEVNDAAIADAPDMPEPRLGRATALLALGDYARGWPAYAARWEVPGGGRRGFNVPCWQATDLSGKTLLVHAEQGLGDAIQFLRFVPRVAASFRGRVILEVHPPLLRLCKALPAIDCVVARGAALPHFDAHCPLMDLGGVFLQSLEDLAPANPYLSADPDVIAAWPLPPADGALRVGLVWAGQARHDVPHALVMDRRRSMTLAAFSPLAPLCQAGRITLVSLQVGAAAGEIGVAPDGLIVSSILGPDVDFADTAAVIAQLDLVIAVDTSTAHLAAAMGKPVWLLSRFDACWRWMRGRDDSPWYPSMTIFRQSVCNDWAGVIRRVAEKLEQITS